MILKKQLGRTRVCGLVGGGLTALVGVLLLVSSFGQGWARRSYDWLFAARPSLSLGRDDLVIVDMDDDSEARLGLSPTAAWDRCWHARLLEKLTTLEAQVVVFDVFFRNATTHLSPADRELLAAAEAHGKVLFAAITEEETSPSGQPGLKVVRPFSGQLSLERVGMVEESLSPDGMFRQHFPGRLRVSTLAWKVAELTLADTPGNLPGRRWINYYGPAGTVPHVSFWRVLSNSVPSTIQFSNKVVYVGARMSIPLPRGFGTDYHQTPYGAGMPGVEVNATVCLNLLRGDWLRRLPLAAEVLLAAFFGLAGGFLLTRVNPLGAALWGLLAALAVAFSAVLLFRWTDFWFPWLVMAGGQIPCAAGWSVLARAAGLTEPTPVPQAEAALEKATAVDHVRAGQPPAVSDHTLLRCIGQGAYGEVWLARDILGAYRAVKVVHRARFDQDKPFEREFNGIQQYAPISRSHPGWIDILHVGRNEAGGYFFYIMELGDDQSDTTSLDPERYQPKTLASELRRRGKLPLEECVRVSLALADALDHLHRHGLIHRDVKPSNVIFVQSAPKFADIGLVTRVSIQSGDVSFLGTAGYVAPEGPGAPTADIYSLGMLIFEIGTGSHRDLFPEFPTAWFECPSTSPAGQLSRIIMRACEYQPEKRYPTAAALREDLARLLEALSP